MSYRGMMDGWNGDENECQGHCYLCKRCDEAYYSSCDEEFERWRDEQEAI